MATLRTQHTYTHTHVGACSVSLVVDVCMGAHNSQQPGASRLAADAAQSELHSEEPSSLLASVVVVVVAAVAVAVVVVECSFWLRRARATSHQRDRRPPIVYDLFVCFA